MLAQVLLEEVAIRPNTDYSPSIENTRLQEWAPKAKLQEGSKAHPSAEICVKDLLSLTLPIRARPNFPQSQCLPSGSLHKHLIIINQKTDRIETTIKEN